MRDIKKVVITGATGVVGMALIQELVEKGISIIVISHKGSQRTSLIPKNKLIKIIDCDLKDYGCLSSRINEPCDAFYHLAWNGTYGMERNDAALQERNIAYTLEAVKQAAELGCRVFIGVGSQSEFGHVEGIMKPDMPCNPDNGYGIAKLAAGRLGRLEAEKLGMDFIWCRIISMYGPYDGKHTMIMSSILKMLKGEKCSFTKGDQIWDYIYSKDAARAFRLLAERGHDGEIYCIGTGKTGRLRDFIEMMRDTVDSSLPVEFGAVPYYPNQVMHLEADIGNLTSDTGFVPEYSFEEGIKETIEWARKFFY